MIKNITKKTIIAKNKTFLKSEFSKAKGLMLAKKITDTGLVFVFKQEKVIALHMFLVFFPIDVLWLNHNRKVVDMKEHFKPFTVILAKKPSLYIIELPDGAISKSETKIGNVVEF